ncbi:MAG: SMP-30/gluconolactonase/LRE family protein, partial [Planctomycetales bacterium]|nr:SMP-30/gluconolactonase/LRE family protein [Planctomycetales bacterium]
MNVNPTGRCDRAALIVLTIVCLSMLCEAPAARSANRYAGLDNDKYLSEATTLATIPGDEVFTEGPAVDRNGLVYFTNIPADQILTWNPKTRQLATFRENTQQTNGLLFDRQGRLLMCQGGAVKLLRLDMQTGQVETLAEKYNGFPLAAPNDVTIDPQGRIYFSSRPGVDDPQKGNVNAVYRVDPDGSLHQALAWPQVHMPNGLVISPDGKTLYLIEAHPDADHHRDIRAYDIAADGALLNERVLIDFYPGRSGDGMCIDAEGNLYVAAGLHKTRDTSETLDTRPGIHVISPAGRLLAYRETPVDTVTNCTFGGPDGKTLYVASGAKLVS